ncbi:ankyrin repeat domain-containing protein [Weissella muntiaci]|nr:ankyrin repeat domain-containing protein [Weissella muntiaci]
MKKGKIILIILVVGLLVLLTLLAFLRPNGPSQNKNVPKSYYRQKGTSEQMKKYVAGTLLEATKQADLNRVKKLLTNSTVQVDEVDHESNTALAIAVQKNDVQIAKVLIDHGADINYQNKISDSPYLYAGAQGRTEILAYMLEHSQPDEQIHNRFGGNALIPAAEKGHIDNVRLLLADGRENINHQNNFGYTALIEAVALRDGSETYQEIVRILLENGADQSIRDNDGKTALDYANQYNYVAIRALLIAYQ